MQESILGVKSDATVLVRYVVDFSVGYDLQSKNFGLKGDDGKLLISLGRPVSVARPAVRILSSEIVSRGVFTDEKGAIIGVQQRLPEIATNHGAGIVRDPAVVALCEKKFREFLLDFMRKQPGASVLPTIEFKYEAAGIND